MISPISGDLAAARSPAVSNHLSPAEGPQIIHTPATATAPSGRIIDDSARGTIFWEAEDVIDDDGSEWKEQTSNDLSVEQDLGRPFEIEWISTNRLQFFRTRGMRNAWNANREVKIARDGTELEPAAGWRRTKLSIDPSDTTWSTDTSAYGHRLLTSQGWLPSTTLGATNARQVSHYTAANSSHFRVFLRDDNGLEGISGRSNGKVAAEGDAMVERKKRDAVLRFRYGGVMGFVSGGFSIGNRLVINEEDFRARLPDLAL
nr:hypothetical protein B0A51_12423 [Rachicladosporium sp. CCFEE 5018]